MIRVVKVKESKKQKPQRSKEHKVISHKMEQRHRSILCEHKLNYISRCYLLHDIGK